MFAFEVEIGTGSETATSYVTTAYAEDYIASMPSSANIVAWGNLSSSDKELKLIQASRYLDSRYEKYLAGYRAKQIQALAWPRYEVFEYRFLIGSDQIPDRLKRATIEAALLFAGSVSLVPTTVTEGVIVSERKVVGPIEKETHYDSAGKSGTALSESPIIAALLEPYLVNKSRTGLKSVDLERS